MAKEEVKTCEVCNNVCDEIFSCKKCGIFCQEKSEIK